MIDATYDCVKVDRLSPEYKMIKAHFDIKVTKKAFKINKTVELRPYLYSETKIIELDPIHIIGEYNLRKERKKRRSGIKNDCCFPRLMITNTDLHSYVSMVTYSEEMCDFSYVIEIWLVGRGKSEFLGYEVINHNIVGWEN
ncbi:MAG: hypothetical protein IMY73_04300 [Bacteroidetes bacterium]|nr:hypothetical protein [Bacteroidota bacterium]